LFPEGKLLVLRWAGRRKGLTTKTKRTELCSGSNSVGKGVVEVP
jgi:hypothetical protein